MNHQARREGGTQVAEFIRAGHHLTTSGESVTLNAFRLAFLQSGRPRGHPHHEGPLKDYFPEHEKAMRAASLAKVAAAGYITPPG